MKFAVVSETEIALFGILILVVFLSFLALCFYGIWLSRRPNSLSPYSRFPLRKGAELSWQSKKIILQFLYYLHEYDNRIFEFRKAAVCRETGRIFINALTWYNKIEVDWTFLQKRYPGAYVSWGSLSSDQKEIVRDAHESLEGFQTEYSSEKPQPSAVEAKFAFLKPGPLYVDLDTYVLLGWKCVPETDFEVLIVQKPTKKL